MAAYVARRVLILIPVTLGVAFLVFAAMYVIPGDAVDSMLAERGATAQELARLRAQLGLDAPMIVQFGRFLANLLQGDLGASIVTGRPVADQIASQLPATIELTLAALAIATLLGVPLGVLAALRRGTITDALTMLIALIGVSMPNFWLGLLLILTFSLGIGPFPSLFPAAGNGTFRHLVLPAVTLGFSGVAVIARITRSSLLEVIHADYVRTARSKGLRSTVVVVKHALRNAMASVMTVIGLQFGALLGGSVVVENVFGRQGIGSLTVTGIQRADAPLVQATVMLAAIAFVLVNLLVDLTYSLLDPRIRYA
jgi:peptide/nickel transport system permease protein